MLSSRNINHVEHIRSEAETVTELLERYTKVDDDKIVRLHISQIHEHGVGQMHDKHHRPKPEFQARLGSEHPAEHAATGQCDNAHGPVHKTYLPSGQTQPACLAPVQ